MPSNNCKDGTHLSTMFFSPPPKKGKNPIFYQLSFISVILTKRLFPSWTDTAIQQQWQAEGCKHSVT